MKHQDILVVGGAGFVGRHVVNRLVDRGLAVTVPTRRPGAAKHLITLPTVDLVEADVNDDADLDRLLEGRDAVVNLVGILQGSRGVPYGREFAQAHIELPRRIVARCAAQGIRRYLHMSSLGADSRGPSMYQRSKGDGEATVRASALDWTIFRPSVIFGPEDRFLNTFATLATMAPVLPIANAATRFQPVWVVDVADAFANALDNPKTYRQIYEMAGPRIYTLRELVRFAASASGHPRVVVGLPAGLARAQATLMELAPGEPLMSRDNLDSMQRDNIATAQPYTPAPELGIELHSMETEAAEYLSGQGQRSRLGSYRARARR
ncbi:MAG TPA: complex I NDUFA9 subunit family protein [Burkholderiaceae bacterium]|nr:complex I NDUFA9 subunit family protein [Burkholderiaceae bacterium]